MASNCVLSPARNSREVFCRRTPWPVAQRADKRSIWIRSYYLARRCRYPAVSLNVQKGSPQLAVPFLVEHVADQCYINSIALDLKH